MCKIRNQEVSLQLFKITALCLNHKWVTMNITQTWPWMDRKTWTCEVISINHWSTIPIRLTFDRGHKTRVALKHSNMFSATYGHFLPEQNRNLITWIKMILAYFHHTTTYDIIDQIHIIFVTSWIIKGLNCPLVSQNGCRKNYYINPWSAHGE